MVQSEFPPVILLGFSNQRENFLPALHSESYHIWRLLRDLEQFNFIRVYREESLTNEELTDYMTFFKESIQVLHFSGHGSGEALLTEEDFSDPRGVGAMMKWFPALQLVVLNACETREQAQLYLDAGVPVVIATTLKVEDEQAMRFSELFYSQLAVGTSINEAFDLAIAGLASNATYQYGEFASREAVPYKPRGIKLKTETTDDCPWQIYVRKDEELDGGNAYKDPFLINVSDTVNLSPLKTSQLIRIVGSSLRGLSQAIRQHNSDYAKRLAKYLDRSIEIIEHKIWLIETNQPLDTAINRKAIIVDTIDLLAEATDDKFLKGIAEKIEDRLKGIIELQTKFNSATPELQKQEKTALIKNLKTAIIYFKETKALLML